MIFGAGCILYALIFGPKTARRMAPAAAVQSIMAIGLLLYAGVGVASLLMGGNFLDYNVLRHDAQHGQHLGILLVELGVGLTVAAVMFSVFMTFSLRAKK